MNTASKGLFFGFINVILSATAMASLPILGKIAYQAGLGPINTLLLRYISAFVILSLVLFLGKRTRIFAFTPLIMLQGVFLVTASVFYFYTLQYLSAGLTNVIFFTHPIIVATLAILIYKEKLFSRLIIGLLMALVGIMLISGIGAGDETIQIKGLLLGSVASINYALYSLIGQKTVQQTDSLVLTNTLALMCVILLMLVFNDQVPTLVQLSIDQISIGMLIGLLATVLAVTFLMRGIRLIGASKASLISASEPAITLVIAFFILGEVLNVREMMGSLLIMISIIFAVYPR